MGGKLNIETESDSLWPDRASVLDSKYNPLIVALRIAIIYMVIGALWIILSDRVLSVFIHQKEAIIFASMVKGWVYVLSTGWILFLLVVKPLKKIKVSEENLKESFNQLRVVHEELTASEAFSRMIIAKMLNAYALHKIIVDDSGQPCDYEYVDVNPSFEEFTGLKREAVIGKRYKELVPEIHIEKTDWIGIYGKVAITGIPVMVESYTEAFGKWVNVNAYCPREGYFITVFNDISKIKKSELELSAKNEELTSLYEELAASEEELRQQLEELNTHQERLRISEERFRLASEGSNGAIWDVDLLEGKYYFSDRWFDLLGYEKTENSDLLLKFNDLLHPDDSDEAREKANAHLQGEIPFYNHEYRLRCQNREYKWFLCRGKALFGKDGRAIRFAGSITDIDERKKMEVKLQQSNEKLEVTNQELYATQEELKKQLENQKTYQERLHQNAYYDYLTGLPNRLSLYENLAKHLNELPHIRKALIFIDTDNFKFINDTLGHFFGDQLITFIGRRLTSLFGDKHHVYRLGGDEFIVFIHGFGKIEEVREYTEKVFRSFNAPIHIGDSTLYVSVSIGISTYPENGDSADELIQNADIAMYRAKTLGKSKYVFFCTDMQEKVKERMTIEKHLRSALKNNEFILYYQPQLDIKSGKIAGFEALLRWNNPVIGFISPLKFIGIAEETHLIISIGQWVLENACAFLKQMHARGYKDLTIAVNVSILQLLQEDFIDTVYKVLKLTGINPKHLELEITESILMESYQMIRNKLNRLREVGIKIALDDFGQGYSSLSYLKQLPINTLKIDKSFIDSINSVNYDESLTGSIVMIGRKMGLTILAEGVESQDQMDYLTKHRCHKIQGYLISKPIPQDEAINLFERWNSCVNKS